jgi:hypothetical protein
MPPWVEAFPQASVLVGSTRIPRTANGKKLLAMPRVSTLDPDRVLPQFAGQLEFVSFRGLFGAPDHASPGEGGPDGFRMMMNVMFSMMFKMKDPVDELWTFHVPSRTLIGGRGRPIVELHDDRRRCQECDELGSGLSSDRDCFHCRAMGNRRTIDCGGLFETSDCAPEFVPRGFERVAANSHSAVYLKAECPKTDRLRVIGYRSR